MSVFDVNTDYVRQLSGKEWEAYVLKWMEDHTKSYQYAGNKMLSRDVTDNGSFTYHGLINRFGDVSTDVLSATVFEMKPGRVVIQPADPDYPVVFRNIEEWPSWLTYIDTLEDQSTSPRYRDYLEPVDRPVIRYDNPHTLFYAMNCCDLSHIAQNIVEISDYRVIEPLYWDAAEF